jgi:hypothetical protein
MNGQEKLTVVRSTFWRMLYGCSCTGAGLAFMCMLPFRPALEEMGEYAFAGVFATAAVVLTAMTWIFAHLFFPYRSVVTFDPETRTVTVEWHSIRKMKDYKNRTIPWDKILTVIADGDSVKLVLKDSEVVFVRSFNLIRKVEALRERITAMLGLDRGDEK